VPTGLRDKKYSVHPIYFTILFSDVGNENHPLDGGADHLPSTLFCLRDLMTDLLLQGLENITNERLGQVLSNEKKEMLDEKMNMRCMDPIIPKPFKLKEIETKCQESGHIQPEGGGARKRKTTQTHSGDRPSRKLGI